jgi:upstream activation factor subunit UAF30
MAKATKQAEKTVSKTPKKAAGSTPKAAAGGGLKAPMTPSADLAAVIGTEAIPRTEIIKKIWDYIKAHKLQDEKNKKMINADEKLKKVFGGKEQISMFELAKVISNHVK